MTDSLSSKQRLLNVVESVIQRARPTSASANDVLVHRALIGEMREALFAFLAEQPVETSVLPDQLLDVHAICDERDRLRVDNSRLVAERDAARLIARKRKELLVEAGVLEGECEGCKMQHPLVGEHHEHGPSGIRIKCTALKTKTSQSEVERLCTCTFNRLDGQPHMETCSRYGIPDLSESEEG